jgi:hypothetical protein
MVAANGSVLAMPAERPQFCDHSVTKRRCSPKRRSGKTKAGISSDNLNAVPLSIRIPVVPLVSHVSECSTIRTAFALLRRDDDADAQCQSEYRIYENERRAACRNYPGKADASGEAAVELPEWFETLNRDFRYQLTVIGQFAQAIVANKVANHRFVIKTNKPNVEVSWQVTGIRQDSFANAHHIPVETEKAPADRGHYLYPELVGAPETTCIGYMTPAPGSEHVVHNRSVICKRDGVAEPQRTPLHVPVLSTMPHPPTGKLTVNQK